MKFFYKICDTVFLDIYCYFYSKKSIATLIMLYFVSLLINTALCDYDFESQNENSEHNDYNGSTEEKKYTFSQLNNQSEVNCTEEDSAFDHLTSQQKRILLGAIVFGICVVSLWIIMNFENRDLKKAISELEKKKQQRLVKR